MASPSSDSSSSGSFDSEEDKTLQVARRYGAVRVIQIKPRTRPSNAEEYNYILVLDFEATCWEKTDKRKGQPEIIEFPVVLYDCNAHEIVAEFQHYVKPSENPRLNAFCTELTGIKQDQVDGGLSLADCLKEFDKWMETMKEFYELEFDKTKGGNLTAFVTWSDWDIGICLRNELKRKKIPMADMFKYRVDLKHVFSKLYSVNKSLADALFYVGLKFEGNEHCGLHDARNTAKLAGKILDTGELLYRV